MMYRPASVKDVSLQMLTPRYFKWIIALDYLLQFLCRHFNMTVICKCVIESVSMGHQFQSINQLEGKSVS